MEKILWTWKFDILIFQTYINEKHTKKLRRATAKCKCENYTNAFYCINGCKWFITY